ncbi:MAG TPA: hypothetical protein VKP11_11225 [Frankiaceae bacterium]|nr:hypothetical protein [Frankiaceae bacterium]
MTTTSDRPRAGARRPGASVLPGGGPWRRLRPRPDGLLLDLRVALPPWAVARVVVLAVLALARWLVPELHASLPAARWRLDQGLFGWDAGSYAQIAAHGYARVPADWIRYFPLYPLSGRALGAVLGSSDAGLLVVSNGLALLWGALLHRLALRETADPALARRAAWLVALAPPGFMLVMAYGEALFGVLTVAVFLAVRRGRFGAALLPAVLAGLTRPTGFLLAAPVAVEAARGLRRASGREWALRLAAVAAPFVGTAAYLGWVAGRFGEALLPYRVQTDRALHGPYRDPVTIVREIWNGWGGPQEFSHLPWAALVVVLVVVLGRRWPASYTVFAALAMGSAFTALNLNSWERYALGTSPLVLAAAQLAGGRVREPATLVVSGALLVCYALLAFVGLYVP